MVVVEKSRPKTVPPWMKFVIGGFSGAVSTTIVQPADLVKTRMQILGPKGKDMSSIEMARGIVRRKGIKKGLYAGYSASLIRQLLYSGCRLGGFNTVFEMYEDEYKKPPSGRLKVALGMASGVFGTFVSMPLEVAVIRMTADGNLALDKRKNYKNVFECVSRLVREEGLSSLGKGFFPTLTRSMLLNGAQLATYAQAREALLYRLGDGVTLHFTSSIIAGIVTTFVCQPIDMIKTSAPSENEKKTKDAVSKCMAVNETSYSFRKLSKLVLDDPKF